MTSITDITLIGSLASDLLAIDEVNVRSTMAFVIIGKFVVFSHRINKLPWRHHQGLEDQGTELQCNDPRCGRWISRGYNKGALS
jgi:hypothetical protein